jgi:glycosyltransferase involved in cell wall biosynthesis
MITVIIPSKGRNSLKRALSSLIFQTNPNWICFVILDGVEINDKIIDDRIIYYSSPKAGNGLNGAGLVRNKGIELSDSEWICFLDDDDSFSPDYINNLYNEISLNSNMDVCIFRMTYSPENDTIIPPFGGEQIAIGQVGISFAINKNFINKHDLRFINSQIEDYFFLEKCEKLGANIHFSNHISYLVNQGFI